MVPYYKSTLLGVTLLKFFIFAVALNDLNDVTNNTSTGPSPISAPPAKRSNKEIIHIAVLLPQFPADYPVMSKLQFSLNRVMPGIDNAIKSVEDRELVPNFDLQVRSFNTRCDSSSGPIAAIDLMINRTLDVLIGPSCDYSAAPVARYTRHWKKPMITAGAAADSFKNKIQYFVTRTHVVFDKVGSAVSNLIMDEFHYKHFAYYLFYKYQDATSLSACRFATAAVHAKVRNRLYLNEFNDTKHDFHTFSELEGPTYDTIIRTLKLISTKARGMFISFFRFTC